MAATLDASREQLAASVRGLVEEQTLRLADLIESNESLGDFHSDLMAHVASMDTIRRELMELAMMEQTFRKVATALQPLVALTDLRRLSTGELQLAADAIRRDRAIAPRAIVRNGDAEPIQPVLAERPFAGRPVVAERPVPEPIDGPVLR